MFRKILWTSLVTIPLLAVLSLLIGSSGISFQTLWEGLTFKNPASIRVIYELRLPRIVLAGLVGASLSVSGYLMQTISQNRLVSPSMIGIVDGALLGLVAGKMLGLVFPLASQLSSILGGLLTVALVYFLASVIPGGFVKTRFILLGLLVSQLIGALANLLSIKLSFFRDAGSFFLGTVSDARWEDVYLVLGAVLLSLLPLLYLIYQLDGFHMGDEMLYSLGKPVRLLKTLAICLATLLTAVSISVVGKIHFMGLLVPNMVAMLGLASPRKNLVVILVLGINLILAADIVSKLLRYPYETPIALVISLLGLPFFFYLIKSRGGRHA